MAENTTKTEQAAKPVKADPKPAAKAKKSNKPSLLKRLGTFLKECWAERKKIVWYSKDQTIHSTLLVLASLIVCSIVISFLDFGFSSVISMLSRLL